ncbi:alanine racemase [Salmonella enterica]|uniref:Alanine racemase n=1 Tax=Salmonella enterica TaxID=28901 RepID=A0A759Y026_SALER|nr:alanine racemase [Salmonella enterica]WQF98986.1 alanine racemase [Salmonella enterica subsp. enterica serovar Abortusovis]WQG03393.1 alanine racemase [Salmonella enterica subsp. enterica serovar Abortusovis]WQG07858.1 alanine racemase [Salmonella enterica subsp. enterica serovar Abortusovis]WQG12412.1 alanine racemase [Salmonella enterica subsp. enterica serovar Abortusovis]HAG2259285.1 alanine racemase [Salmonella enterica]
MQAATVVINRRALRHNLQRLRELAPASKLVAVVKANAYGHGLLETVRTLPDADAFGVARLEEALRLRAGGITQPILLLEGFFDAADLPTISAQCLHTAVHNQEQLAALEAVELAEPVTVWMKLDTGMHRLGVRPEEAEAFYQRLTHCKNVRQPVNIVSHFARADEPECGATEHQLDIFNAFCQGKPGQRSIAASGGILLWPQSHFDWARPGIILYGVSPLEHKPWGPDFGFQPVMSLTSSLIAVRDHKAGEPVGYGGTWVSERDTRLGVVAMGYGDGYPRAAPSGTPVLVNGREVPIVGRVAMDMICVDLGPNAQDNAGDPVVLWGEGLPVERIAEMTKVSAYELITRLTSRVAMKYID